MTEFTLWARAGTFTTPDGTVHPLFGLGLAEDAEPRLPGPVLTAYVGDTVAVTLENRLDEPTSLTFWGQELAPQPERLPDGSLGSLVRQAPPGGSVTYQFTALRPGTFHYETGTDPQRQLRLGLYGALIVLPRGYDQPLDPDWRTAYGAGTDTASDGEGLLVLGETLPGAESGPGVARGTPVPGDEWWLVNGRPFPLTLAPVDNSSQPETARFAVIAGQTWLLRIINCGLLPHTLSFAGGPVRVRAVDGRPLCTGSGDRTFMVSAHTVGPGQSVDVAWAPAAGEHYVYGAELVQLANRGQFPGGMMALVDARPVHPDGAPAPVTDLRGNATRERVLLGWRLDSELDGVRVERDRGQGFVPASVLWGRTLSFIDRDVVPGTAVSYRVAAFAGHYWAGPSAVLELRIPLFGPAQAPTGLTLQPAGADAVRVSWLDNSGGSAGFVIERRADGAEFAPVGEAGVGVTTYLDAGLVPGTRYGYRVCAQQDEERSPYSAVAEIVLVAGPPGTPARLTVTGLPSNRALLTWERTSDDETGFIIERSWVVSYRFGEVSRTGRGVTTFVDQGLRRTDRYFYRVRSYNAWGVSPSSNVVWLTPR